MNKLLLIVLLSMSSDVLANKVNTYDELTSALEDIRVENNIPAMSVAIITSGKVSYTRGFGFIDAKMKKATKPTSLFRVASISKLFTAQAIMQLVEKNKIALNDKVGRHLPNFIESDITVKQLLTHTSGLGDNVKPLGYEQQRTISSYLELVKKSSLTKVENKTFEYSDANYNVLGAVISAVSGVSFEKYVSNNILIPAKMSKSGYFNGENAFYSEAKPTYKGKVIDESYQRPYDLSFNPSEGLISNTNDLSQWLALTLSRDSSILNKQTYLDMLKPQVKTSWGEIYMGLGWQVYTNSNDTVARHPGSIRGYKSLVLTYPDSENALIILTNSSNTPRWEIANTITKVLKQNSQW
ncbi:beta-lactamase family protein [Pseudoalteromonas luteoviolacea]|uniref:serine hydrolase domain-containing protein n=1 Tax=Pseudoalteromonas luteoviolacea TaxID=43657 RepID=UPI001B38A41A|nr:beta-lactamase family protein [Pseudoalteromonas luteoviolacea]